MEIQEGLAGLTPAERLVLRLMSDAMSTREIAELLSISERTVENRRCRIVQKLDLHGPGRLAGFAVRYRSFL